MSVTSISKCIPRMAPMVRILIARFMGPACGPSGAARTQVGPMLAPWTLLSGYIIVFSKKASQLRVSGLCVGNSPGTGEFPAQMASNADNVSIWWRHHELRKPLLVNASHEATEYDYITIAKWSTTKPCVYWYAVCANKEVFASFCLLNRWY